VEDQRGGANIQRKWRCDELWGSYRGVKLLEHSMTIVERVLERRIRSLVNLDEMQLGFMPGKRTMDALFVVRRWKKNIEQKRKRCTCVF